MSKEEDKLMLVEFENQTKPRIVPAKLIGEFMTADCRCKESSSLLMPDCNSNMSRVSSISEVPGYFTRKAKGNS